MIDRILQDATHEVKEKANGLELSHAIEILERIAEKAKVLLSFDVHSFQGKLRASVSRIAEEYRRGLKARGSREKRFLLTTALLIVLLVGLGVGAGTSIAAIILGNRISSLETKVNYIDEQMVGSLMPHSLA